jgi:hypothetical protein
MTALLFFMPGSYAVSMFVLIHCFLPPAGGLRNRNAAAFCPLKKYATHFFNSAFGGTGQKEAAYPVTGKD